MPLRLFGSYLRIATKIYSLEKTPSSKKIMKITSEFLSNFAEMTKTIQIEKFFRNFLSDPAIDLAHG